MVLTVVSPGADCSRLNMQQSQADRQVLRQTGGGRQVDRGRDRWADRWRTDRCTPESDGAESEGRRAEVD